MREYRHLTGFATGTISRVAYGVLNFAFSSAPAAFPLVLRLALRRLRLFRPFSLCFSFVA